MELQRNPFLINRALSKFLMASVFSAVAIQLAAMIDSIIVANFVGPVWVVRYSYRRPSGRTTWNTAVI